MEVVFAAGCWPHMKVVLVARYDHESVFDGCLCFRRLILLMNTI